MKTINLADVKSLHNLGIIKANARTESLKYKRTQRVQIAHEALNITKAALSYLVDILDAEKIFYSNGTHAYRYYISKNTFKQLSNILNIYKGE